jgi:hypothetical protein
MYRGLHSGSLDIGDLHHLWDNPLVSPYGYWHPQSELHARWWFERTPSDRRALDAATHEVKNLAADTAITYGVSGGVKGAVKGAYTGMRNVDFLYIGNRTFKEAHAAFTLVNSRFVARQAAFYAKHENAWLGREALKALEPWRNRALTGKDFAKSGYDAATFPVPSIVRPIAGTSRAARQAISAFLNPLQKAGPYIRNATWAAKHAAPEVFTNDQSLSRYYARPTFGTSQYQWRDIIAGRYGFRFPNGSAPGMRDALTYEAMTVSLWMGNHARGGNARPDELLGYRSDLGKYIKNVAPSQTMPAQLYAGHLIELYDRARIDGLTGSIRNARTRPLDVGIVMGPEYYRQLHREQRLYLRQALPIAGYASAAQRGIMRELEQEQRAAIRSQVRRQEAVVGGLTRLAAGFGVPVPMAAGAQTLAASVLRSWWAAPSPDLPSHPRWGHIPPRRLATRVTRNRGGHIEVVRAPQGGPPDSQTRHHGGHHQHHGGAKKSSQYTRKQAIAWARAIGLYVPPGLSSSWKGTSIEGGTPAVVSGNGGSSGSKTSVPPWVTYGMTKAQWLAWKGH